MSNIDNKFTVEIFSRYDWLDISTALANAPGVHDE